MRLSQSRRFVFRQYDRLITWRRITSKILLFIDFIKLEFHSFSSLKKMFIDITVEKVRDLWKTILWKSKLISPIFTILYTRSILKLVNSHHLSIDRQLINPNTQAIDDEVFDKENRRWIAPWIERLRHFEQYEMGTKERGRERRGTTASRQIPLLLQTDLPRRQLRAKA